MAGEKSFGKTLKNGVLLLVLVGLLLALLYGVHRWTERYDGRLELMATQLRQQTDAVSALERLLAEQADITQQKLQQQQSLLDDHQLLLHRLNQIGGDEWQLREAWALSRMAEQRLQLMGDYDGAVRLLNAASAVLLQTRLPAGSDVQQLLKEDAALTASWYQSAQKNLHSALESVRTLHPAVFKSAQSLSLREQETSEPASWQTWFEQLPLRFTPRHQPAPENLSVEQARQQLNLFRFLLAQADIAGLMQKHAEQVRILDEMSRLVQALPLADQETLVLLQQAIEDARQQAASLGKPLQLKSTAALAALVQGG